jgi:hypothetical protein
LQLHDAFAEARCILSWLVFANRVGSHKIKVLLEELS